jgi:hypothetical protein
MVGQHAPPPGCFPECSGGPAIDQKVSAIPLTVIGRRQYKRKEWEKAAAGMAWLERARPG